MPFPTDWKRATDDFITAASASGSALKDYARANVATCQDVVAGRDFYSGNANSESGARMVVNISAAHIPAFCLASRNGQAKPYKNGYDLGQYRIGSPPDYTALKLREIVDASLPLQNCKPDDVYFGAVELTGPGIRFYGDICLVLRRTAVPPDTVVLDRNSFDLITAPLRDEVNRMPAGKTRDEKRKEVAAKLAGFWHSNMGHMAALRSLQILGMRPRRYTMGQIAEVVRHDEDYLEVLKSGSFGAVDLQEARLAAGDAAHDALTADRLRSGPAPRLESLLWRQRRRVADEELRKESVVVRVVTSSGRSRD